jgi:acid phosphatase
MTEALKEVPNHVDSPSQIHVDSPSQTHRLYRKRQMSNPAIRCTAEPLESRVLMAAGLPRFDHVVVVVEENHSYSEVLGPISSPATLPFWTYTPATFLNYARYMRNLAREGASLRNAHAETHPSQPNYLALFSGSTQGVTTDAVPAHKFTTPSLGGQLIAAGLTFAGYSEDLPAPGSLADKSGYYNRAHNPWSDFEDVPASANLPFSRFPRHLSHLPTVSFVVPNRLNDMHSANIRRADHWLEDNLKHYADWAVHHNSLLIVTWDESDEGGNNQIPTIFWGAHVRKVQYPQHADHFDLLRTIEDVYDLPPLGRSADVAPITQVFR